MRLVILDRDGVINEDSDAYIKAPEEWVPIPGSVEAIAKLSAAGITVVVATNQSGLARGLFDQASLDAIHHKMMAAVNAAGGRLAGIYHCPHGPDDGCSCRKPHPGLLEAIRNDCNVDLKGVPVIGDSERDLVAAQAVGARPILVHTGKGRDTALRLGEVYESYSDLAAAVDALLKEYNA